MSAEQDLTGSNFDFSATVEIYVGPNRKLYHVHKELFVGASRLLQNAEGSIALPNEQPRLFQVYMEWLYKSRSKAVLKALKAHEVIQTATGKKDMPGARVLIELFLLGERLGDVQFKNTITSAYIKALVKSSCCINCFAAQIYSQLPPDSPFKRLYVDMWAWSLNESSFEDLEPGDDPLAAPATFWFDVTKKVASYGESRFEARAKPPWVANKAQYLEKEVQTDDEAEPSDEGLDVGIKQEAF